MDHGEAIKAHAEGVAGQLGGIKSVVAAAFVDGLEDGGIDHAATGDFNPLGLFAFDLELHIDLEAGFGEGEEVGAEADFGVVAEHGAVEEFERTFEVGEADVFVNVEAFELVEDGKVGGVDFIATIGRAGGDDFDGRGLLFHGADLHGGGVGAEEFAGVEVEGVGVVPGGVVGGGVEGVEAVEFSFDFGSVREGEAEAAKDLDGAVLDDGEWVQGPGGEGAGRHGRIDACDEGGIGSILKALFLSIESCGDGLPGGVEGGTEFGLFLIGEVAHFGGEGVERAFLA